MRVSSLFLSTFSFCVIALSGSRIAAEVPLDSNCVVSALNRTSRVLSDGSWVLPNVPSNFGSIRVRANCANGGVVRAGQSGFVRLPPGGTLHVSDIVFDAPRPIPARLTLRSPRVLLTGTGESAELEAIATLPDGSVADVTPAETGTNYRTSNPGVATVSENGLVTAVASGSVLVSATHEGTLGVVEITVIAAGDGDGDGLPDDYEVANGLDPGNAADAQLDPDGDGLSIGDEFRRGLDAFDADTDGDGLEDGREVMVVGTDGLRFDTDGDGLSDGLELELGTDPRDAVSFDYAAALVSLEIRPAAFAIVFDTALGEDSQLLSVIGVLRDGSSIDLTSPVRGTSWLSSDLAVCALGVEPGRVFAGQPGDCTITVTSAGRSATARGIVQTFSPRWLASVVIPGSANAIEVSGEHAFVAAGGAGLQVVDVGDRRSPSIAGSSGTTGAAADVAVSGVVAVVAVGAAGIDLFDLTTPASPRRVATLAMNGVARGVATAGSLAIVAATDLAGGSGTLRTVSLVNAAAPTLLGSAPTAGAARAVAIDDDGRLAAVAAGPLGVELFDLTDPASPIARGRAATADARAVTFVDGHLLVADAATSFTVIDARDAVQPRVIATLPRELGGIPLDVTRFEDLAFTADLGFFAEEAIPIFDVTDPATPQARSRLALPTPDPGRAVDADATWVYLVACAGCDGVAGGQSHLDIGQYRSLRDELGVAPQIELTAPHDGDFVTAGSMLAISAEASDDVGVLAVELLVDGVVVARDERPPYGATITVPATADRLSIGARAFDFAANAAVAAPVEVLVARAGVTTVAGVVAGPLDEPVAGARVVVNSGGSPGVPAAAVTATTDSNGAFVAADLAVGAAPLVAQASSTIAGAKHRGSSSPVLPSVGATTDVGTIRLQPIDTLYPGPRTLTGASARAIVRADFDGDGTSDLAVSHSVAASGVAILGGSRDGRFVVRQRFALSSSNIAAGDLTLDGAPDLVVGTSGRVVVLRNDGEGTLEVAEDRSTANTSFPRLGDFDSDGAPDVLFMSVANRSLALLFGNGDGTLRTGPVYPLTGTPEDVAIGDFDLDGDLDVAVAMSNAAAPHAVVVLRGDGAGGLALAATLPFTLPPVRLGAADFDDDGRLDLVVGAGRDQNAKAFVELGNGDGTFTLASSLGTFLGEWPISMAIDDLDRDGALDVAFGRNRSACNDILMVRGDGDGSFLPSQHNRSIADDCGTLPRFAVGDQTADGLPEILALDDAGVTSYVALGGLAFERRLDLITQKVVEQVVSADVDSDGRLDLVYAFDASKSFGVQLGNGDGTFRATTDTSSSIFVQHIGSGDVDRDGDVDLVVASANEVRALLGAGNGTFLPGALRSMDSSARSLHVADVTGDGAADVIATLGLTDRLVMYESRGDGTLESAVSSAVGDLPTAATIADFDHDGRPDVAVANFNSDDVSLLLGSGGGAFAAQVRYSVGDQPLSIAAADVDLDGDVDLVTVGGTITVSSSGPNATVLLGDGHGAFVPLPRLTPATAPIQVAVTDADADGLVDLVLLGSGTNDLSILLGAGDGTFLPQEWARTGDGARGLAVVDLDADGQPDLVTANSGSDRPGLSVLLHR